MDITPKSYDDECCTSDSPGEEKKHFPYGTSLNLDDEVAEGLGFESLSVGDVVEVRGLAFIERKRSSEHAEMGEEEESDKGMTVQFTKIDLIPQSPDRTAVLYPGGESE